MTDRYRLKYTYEITFGTPRHMWSAVGQHGGVHLHIEDRKADRERHQDILEDRYSGGVEVHYRTPPFYMENTPPSHDDCFLLHTPCWHDGTSLGAERFIEAFRHDGDRDHKLIFSMLTDWADGSFQGDDDDEPDS